MYNFFPVLFGVPMYFKQCQIEQMQYVGFVGLLCGNQDNLSFH